MRDSWPCFEDSPGVPFHRRTLFLLILALGISVRTSRLPLCQTRNGQSDPESIKCSILLIQGGGQPGGTNQFPDGSCTRSSPAPFTAQFTPTIVPTGCTGEHR